MNYILKIAYMAMHAVEVGVLLASAFGSRRYFKRTLGNEVPLWVNLTLIVFLAFFVAHAWKTLARELAAILFSDQIYLLGHTAELIPLAMAYLLASRWATGLDGSKSIKWVDLFFLPLLAFLISHAWKTFTTWAGAPPNQYVHSTITGIQLLILVVAQIRSWKWFPRTLSTKTPAWLNLLFLGLEVALVGHIIKTLIF